MEVKPKGDKKRAFELSPIVKISLMLYLTTFPEGGCKTGSTEDFIPEGESKRKSVST